MGQLMLSARQLLKEGQRDVVPRSANKTPPKIPSRATFPLAPHLHLQVGEKTIHCHFFFDELKEDTAAGYHVLQD